MLPHQEHVWFIGCVFNTPCPICAFFMHWSCIAHSHFLHTPLLPLSCIRLYLIFSSQNVMFTLCFVALCFVIGLSFIFSFISHFLCIIIIVRSFISCPRFSLTLCLFLTKRGRVYSREYTRVFCHFFMTLVHIFKGRNSISHAHLQGERYSIGEMHIPRGRRHCVNQKTLFCLFSCRLYGALSYALLFSLHHVCVLDMYISLCYCASLNACSDDHLLCYVIIVVISI